MKFLIVEPFPLPILIPLGPKYSPQDSVLLPTVIPVERSLTKPYITLPKASARDRRVLFEK